MNNYYFTFGSNHRCPETDIPLGNSYLKVSAYTMEAARNLVFEIHSDKWAFAYTEADFAGQAEQFNLQRHKHYATIL